LQNGNLLDAAEQAGFAVIITVDKNLRHQHNLTGRKISIITLEADGIDLQSILPLAGLVMQTLQNLPHGAFITVSATDKA
jgi:hypothetical protein